MRWLLLIGIATTAHAAPALLGVPIAPEVDGKTVAAEVARRGFFASGGPEAWPVGAGACAGCHPDVAREWGQSAHRFSSFNNPYYRISVEDFRAERGAAASKFCANCHEPSLVDSLTTIDVSSRAAQAGVTCLLCHSAHSAGLHGNGDLKISVDEVPLTRGEHGARVRRPILGDARLCGACHKVGLDPEITQDRWLRGQDDYDPWQASSASGHGAGAVWRATEVKRCQDCHMPLVPASTAEAGAKNGVIRSHRFLGGNGALAVLRGDEAFAVAEQRFLQGAVSVDAFWERRAGRPPSAADEPVRDALVVVMRARRVGHRFPGGTMDSNQAWLEVEAFDAAGQLLASSDEHMIRAQAVDDDGAPIARRDPQHMRGVAFDTSLSPSDPQAVRFALPPSTTRATVRLRYRKFSAEYAARACGFVKDPAARARCLAPPIVDIARAEAHPDDAPPSDWTQLLDRGLALAGALVDHADEAEPWLARARAAAPHRAEPLLGYARLHAATGRTDEAVAAARAAAAIDPRHPAAAYLEAGALEKAYRQKAALPAAERLLALQPDDRAALAMAARIRGVIGDAKGALDAADRLIAVDPFLDEGWYQRTLALRELGRAPEASAAEREYLRRRVAVEVDLQLRDKLRARRPLAVDESVPVHTHTLTRISRRQRLRACSRSSAHSPRRSPSASSMSRPRARHASTRPPRLAVPIGSAPNAARSFTPSLPTTNNARSAPTPTAYHSTRPTRKTSKVSSARWSICSI
jgi:tetratricopeptide (TPR) repeat protein